MSEDGSNFFILKIIQEIGCSKQIIDDVNYTICSSNICFNYVGV